MRHRTKWTWILALVLTGCGSLHFEKISATKTTVIPGMPTGNIKTTLNFTVVAKTDIENIGTIYMNGWESYRSNESELIGVGKGDTLEFSWTHSTPANETDSEEILDLAQIRVKGDSLNIIMYSIRQSSMPRSYALRMDYSLPGGVPQFFVLDTLDYEQTIAMP